MREKKKVLIIGNSFYPENSPRAFRTTELTKEFARQGHEVTVYISKNDKEHIAFEKEYGVVLKDLGSKKFKKVEIKSEGKYGTLLNRAIRRGLDLFFHYPNIQWMFNSKAVLKKEAGFDLLITIAVPHPIHWGAALARTKKHPIAKTWVADCGDPFMGATTDTFKRIFYFKYIEKFWNKRCDFIAVPFEGAKEGYYKEFHHKIKIIPQGLNFDDVKIDSSNNKPNPVPTFAYAGGFIPGARDPKELIEYLLDKKIDFKFIVYTQTLQMIESLAEKAKGRIEIKDYIPRNELIGELAKMDFILNFNNSVNTQLPSKLIDYYLTGRPVLSIDSHDFDTKIVDEFLLGNYKNRYKYNNPEQYRIENVCQQFLDLTDAFD